MKYNKSLKLVKFSFNDRKRDIKIPKTITSELSEAVGIIIGDGHVRVKTTGYRIIISGHAIDDRDYHLNHIIPLFTKLFNIKPNIRSLKRNETRLTYSSKALATLFRYVFGIESVKKNISIPKSIKNSTKNIKIGFLRGLFDTDFSITFKMNSRKKHSYPVLHFATYSKKIADNTLVILKELNFRTSKCTYKSIDKRSGHKSTIYHIFINGKNMLLKWNNEIGFGNPKNIKKIKIWEKYGYYPPYTTHEERNRLLSGGPMEI
jgi:hypothetical protein